MYLTNRLAQTQIENSSQAAMNRVACVVGPHLKWRLISKWCPRLGRRDVLAYALRRIGGYVSLRIADDGVGGLPSGVLSVNGVGQQIVKALVDLPSGKLEWANGRGTSATVTFLEMK
jgi:two-component sensor histidine kinase